jgi:hypothetical protein
MRVIGNVLGRERHAAAPPRPGLDVSLFVLDRPRGRVLRLRVSGGARPVRLHLYVDGELVESWTPAPELFTFDLGALGRGLHAVTARAVDATGRWGGDSIVMAGVERADPAPPAPRRRGSLSG